MSVSGDKTVVACACWGQCPGAASLCLVQDGISRGFVHLRFPRSGFQRFELQAQMLTADQSWD